MGVRVLGAGRDMARSHCRVYFSPGDISSLSFISRGEQKARTVRDCEAYCLSAQCRHQLLAKELGEDIEPCGSNCDFCTDPTKVKAALALTMARRHDDADEVRDKKKKLLRKLRTASQREGMLQAANSDEEDDRERHNSLGDKRSGSRSSESTSSPNKRIKLDTRNNTMIYVNESLTSRTAFAPYSLSMTTFSGKVSQRFVQPDDNKVRSSDAEQNADGGLFSASAANARFSGEEAQKQFVLFWRA